MKPTLGGSMFTYNVASYGYCFKEALQSLLDLCDTVVVLDCGSDDGTLDTLREMARGPLSHPNLHLVEGGNWTCAPGYERLAMLANHAKAYLDTDWHFMLQADEVVHEDSIETIRNIIASPGPHDAFACRRFNLFGDPNHHVSLSASSKPCNDQPIRLARSYVPAIGDAESLGGSNHGHDHIDQVKIFHYGMVRESHAFMRKTIDFQSWFFNGHGGMGPDHRIVEMQAEGTFNPLKLIPMHELSPLQYSHPKIMQDWVKERLKEAATWMPATNHN